MVVARLYDGCPSAERRSTTKTDSFAKEAEGSVQFGDRADPLPGWIGAILSRPLRVSEDEVLSEVVFIGDQ